MLLSHVVFEHRKILPHHPLTDFNRSLHLTLPYNVLSASLHFSFFFCFPANKCYFL